MLILKNLKLLVQIYPNKTVLYSIWLWQFRTTRVSKFLLRRIKIRALYKPWWNQVSFKNPQLSIQSKCRLINLIINISIIIRSSYTPCTIRYRVCIFSPTLRGYTSQYPLYNLTYELLTKLYSGSFFVLYRGLNFSSITSYFQPRLNL